MLTVLFGLVGVAILFVSFGERRFLDLDLPCDPWRKVNVVTLTATRDNAFFWDKHGPLPAAELGPMLDKWRAETEDPAVVVSADDTARFGTTIALLDEVRKHGIGSVTFETRTRTP